MKKFSLLFPLFCLLLIISACNDDDVDTGEGEELITTLTLTLTPANGGTPAIMTFQDLDGDGGNIPVVMEGTLDANTIYTSAVTFLNESESPAENITEEIEEEDEEHQVFYAASGINLSASYDDMDDNGNPIGLATTMQTGAASSGTLTVTLRHEPNKDASGVSDGDITNAGGETDIEVTFPVTIQ